MGLVEEEEAAVVMEEEVVALAVVEVEPSEDGDGDSKRSFYRRTWLSRKLQFPRLFTSSNFNPGLYARYCRLAVLPRTGPRIIDSMSTGSRAEVVSGLSAA